MIILLFTESVVLAFLNQTFIEAFVIGLPALGIAIYFINVMPDANLTKHVAALSVMIFSFLHIHQTGGLIEVHFEIFILMAFLIIFGDWRVFVSAIAIVAVHHLSFYFLQSSGQPVYLFDEYRLNFNNVVIHAVYALIEASIAGYIAKLMKDESSIGIELSDIANSVTKDPTAIDLKIRAIERKSDILDNFNNLLLLFDQVITQVKSRVSKLNHNAEQLNAAKDELEQSSANRQVETDSIATSAEQMAVTVSSIAEETAQLSDQMQAANQYTRETNVDIIDINKKNKQLTQALETTSNEVSELASSSHAITTVLTEITGIADQTNLLALNAAIEAARAGEQGRGFAVVADEVRALANRTKESTDKISETLNVLVTYSKSTTVSMEKCISVVTEVIEVTDKAIAQIEQASAIVETSSAIAINVAAAVEQQSSTTDGIAQSTETLRATVQTDIEKIELLSVEAEALKSSAAEMEASVASFK